MVVGPSVHELAMFGPWLLIPCTALSTKAPRTSGCGRGDCVSLAELGSVVWVADCGRSRRGVERLDVAFFSLAKSSLNAQSAWQLPQRCVPGTGSAIPIPDGRCTHDGAGAQLGRLYG